MLRLINALRAAFISPKIGLSAVSSLSLLFLTSVNVSTYSPMLNSSRVVASSALAANNNAPTWIRQLGKLKNDGAKGVAVDEAGNVYIAGYTENSLGRDKPPGLFINNDPFLAKYDRNGTKLWVQQMGDLNLQDGANSVAVDKAGNVYIVGYTYATLPPTGKGGMSDAFVAQYNSSGKLMWTRQFGSAGIDSAKGVAVDGAGNVYITGEINGTFGGSSAKPDVFLAKYNSTGTQIWIKQFGTPVNDYSQSVAVDQAGNIYITGYTDGALPGYTNKGFMDIFVAKYNTSGTQVWLRQFGTTKTDVANGVAVDQAGSIYLTGYTDSAFSGYTNAGYSDAFVAKYNSNGAQVWIRQFGKNTKDIANGVAVDKSGSIYITGTTQGSLGATNAGTFDPFTAKYNSTGTQVWIRQFGTRGTDIANGVAVDKTGSVYITGYTEGVLDPPNSGGANDAFLAKYPAN